MKSEALLIIITTQRCIKELDSLDVDYLKATAPLSNYDPILCDSISAE